MSLAYVAGSFPRLCSCCLKPITEEQWRTLRLVGWMGSVDEQLELRDHDCLSTLAVEVVATITSPKCSLCKGEGEVPATRLLGSLCFGDREVIEGTEQCPDCGGCGFEAGSPEWLAAHGELSDDHAELGEAALA